MMLSLPRKRVLSVTECTHRSLHVAVLAVAAALCTLAISEAVFAQSRARPVRIIALHAVLMGAIDNDTNDIQKFALRCPAGHIPTTFSIAPAHDDQDFYAEAGRQLIDATGSPLDPDALTSTAQLNGGGYMVSLVTVGDAHRSNWNLEIMLQCISALMTTDNTLTLATTRTTAAAGASTTAGASCPADFPVALSGFSNADGVWLRDTGSAPAWDESAKLVPLGDAADGQMGPPTGWQTRVQNRSTMPVPYVVHALCGKAPSAQTFVYSAPTFPEKAFSIFGAVPDDWMALGAAFDSGSWGADYSIDAWIKDGTVVNFQAWHPSTSHYDSNSEPVRAFIAKGVDSRLASGSGSKGQGRAVLAVLAIPLQSTLPPPTSDDVIEFYNASLDHYFITANPKEISDLENGIHAGWVRTGQSFRAYARGSTGNTGRRPVCRAYGRPEAGLNSHFYSASADECFAVLAGLNGAWGLEASEVFAMDMPDAASGACPPNGVPIYRTWNGRADSNHRYTTSIAIRDQMVAKGHVAEGYGPGAIALCGLL